MRPPLYLVGIYLYSVPAANGTSYVFLFCAVCFPGIRRFHGIFRDCPRASKTFCAGNASLCAILINTALRYAPFIGCFPNGKISFHTPHPFRLIQQYKLYYIRISVVLQVHKPYFFLMNFSLLEQNVIATLANRKRVASFRLIPKLFAYLKGKTYPISLSMAICFLENCSIREALNK